MMGYVTAVLVVAALVVLIFLLRHRGRALPDSGNDQERAVTPMAAAERALCLGVMVMRGEFETVVDSTSRERPDLRDAVLGAHAEISSGFNQWLKDDGLWEKLSAREKAALPKPLGEWPDRERNETTCRLESLAAIAWVLKMSREIAPYDVRSDEQGLIRALHLSKPSGRFIREATMRTQAEIAKARDVAELWLWRARTSAIQRYPDKYPAPEGTTFEEIIATAAKAAEHDGLFRSIDGDFPAGGKPYRALAGEDVALFGDIAMGRLHALNWLCGQNEDWGEVTTDT